MKGLLAAAAISAALAGCKQQDLGSVHNAIDSLERRASNLESENVLLNRRLAGIESQQGSRGSVSLDPAASTGYGVMETTHGLLVVSLDDLASRADGSRVSLRFGNLTAATFSGGTIRITYGPRFKPEEESASSWLDKLRVQEMAIVDGIPAGAWTLLSAPLPGIKPDSIGHIEVTVEPTTISLLTAR